MTSYVKFTSHLKIGVFSSKLWTIDKYFKWIVFTIFYDGVRLPSYLGMGTFFFKNSFWNGLENSKTFVLKCCRYGKFQNGRFSKFSFEKKYRFPFSNRKRFFNRFPFWKFQNDSFKRFRFENFKTIVLKRNRFVFKAKRLPKWKLKMEKWSFWKKYPKQCPFPAITRRSEHTCLKLKHINFTHFKIFGTSPETTCFMLFSAITNVISVFYF